MVALSGSGYASVDQFVAEPTPRLVHLEPRSGFVIINNVPHAFGIEAVSLGRQSRNNQGEESDPRSTRRMNWLRNMAR